MADIYQQIWDADQQGNGLKAIKKGTPITNALKQQGYVVVDEKKQAGPEHRLLTEVFIPPKKMKSYKNVEQLFNNYTLDQTKPEVNLPEERAEVQQFIKASYKTPPLQLAREYIQTQSSSNLTDDEWWALLERVWFEQYDMGNNEDLSGFEHVFVGEQKQGKVQGYHFWYKYYLDEHFRLDGEELDLIKFIRWEHDPKEKTADVVTLAYEWRAFDYEKKVFRKLTKPVGGFWVGPSAEGMLALGTVRFMQQAFAPKQAQINGVMYNLELYRSEDDRNLRTFYPVFVRML